MIRTSALALVAVLVAGPVATAHAAPAAPEQGAVEPSPTAPVRGALPLPSPDASGSPEPEPSEEPEPSRSAAPSRSPAASASPSRRPPTATATRTASASPTRTSSASPRPATSVASPSREPGPAVTGELPLATLAPDDTDTGTSSPAPVAAQRDGPTDPLVRALQLALLTAAVLGLGGAAGLYLTRESR